MSLYETSSVITAVICLMMIITGLMFYRKPFKYNSPMGYRTKASTKSHDAWNVANRYAGRGWFGLGVIVLVISLVILIFTRGNFTRGWAIGLLVFQILSALVIIPFTESMLNDIFDENGNRKV